MKRLWPLLISLVALAGCLFPRDGSGTSWKDRLRPFGAPTGPDVVVFEVAVLEVSAGDRFVNGEMWANIDDQLLTPEIRRRLEDQGWRIGKVIGRPPDKLLDLLTSERHNRAAHRITKRAGSPYPILIGPVRENFRFEPDLDAIVEKRDGYEQAQCQIQVTPTITTEGKVQFQFIPQIQYADRKKTGQLIPTFALGLQGNRITKSLTSLEWNLPLELNEYIIVGTRFDKPDSLGFRTLVTADEDRPTQRLFAIRRLSQSVDVVGRLTDPAPAKVPSPGGPLAIP